MLVYQFKSMETSNNLLKKKTTKKALKLAHKVYKDFWIKNEIKDDEKVVRRTNKFDKIALEFIKLRIKEKGTEKDKENLVNGIIVLFITSVD